MKAVELVNLAAALITTVVAGGWVAAYLTQLLKRTQWPSYLKLILAGVMAGLVGLAAAWLTGDVTRFLELWKAGTVTAEQVLVLGGLIFASAQVWYHKFFGEQGWATTVANWGSK